MNSARRSDTPVATPRETAQAIASDCIGFRVRMLNRVMTRIYDEELRPYGIKFSQMNILTAVTLHGPVQPVDVAGILAIEKSTLSRNLGIMRKNGWLKIDRGGRVHALRLAPKGAALLTGILPLWRRAQKKAEVMLGSSAESIQAAGRKVGFGV